MVVLTEQVTQHPYLVDPARLAALEESGLFNHDTEAALDRWTRMAHTLIGAPMAMLSMLDGSHQLVKSHSGIPEDALGDRTIPLSHSLCRLVVAAESRVVVDDTRTDALTRENLAVTEMGIGAYLGMPVTTADGHTLGAFCVIDTEARAWTEDDLAMLEDLGAAVLAEVDLRSTRTRARKQAHDVLMRVLAEREPGLDLHVQHVSGLTRSVAERMGLDADAVDEVTRAAQMHDIGKVAIADDILQKPGPLDAHEWVLMRRHTIFGERILRAAPALQGVARIVRSSHERWDGQGYPDGLRETEIPLGARIVFACDAFDAMTTDRVYQDGRSVAEALAELRENAGRQFDPSVVEALAAHLAATGRR